MQERCRLSLLVTKLQKPEYFQLFIVFMDCVFGFHRAICLTGFFDIGIAVLLFDSAKPDCYAKSIVLWIV